MGLLDSIHIPHSKLDFIIRSVEVANYTPGRIRLYSKHLVNNGELEKKIHDTLGGMKEIASVETNLVTGSILLKYSPEVLRTNTELVRVEEYIKTHAKRR